MLIKIKLRLNFVIAGTLLLLFDNAVAEVTEASIASENSESQKASIPQGSTTILTKVSSTYQNQSFEENDGKNIELMNRKTQDAENKSYDIVINNANKDEEKDDVSTHANSHVEKSSDKFESLSSDGNRKPRYGEIAENSGKSTSTKVVSEDLLRLSRKNELTAATVKLSFNDTKQETKNLEDDTFQESSSREKIFNTTKMYLNANENIFSEKLIANVMETSESKEMGKESPIKYEEKNNIAANEQDIPTVKPIRNFFTTTPKSKDAIGPDEKDKTTKLDHKEAVSRKDKNIISTDLREEVEDHTTARNRELTTARNENSPGFKKNANDLGTTASEALDLEKIDEKEHEGTASLINDTYVNYNHFYKTVTEKDPKASTGNYSIDMNESPEKGDPKEEVEIVKNVTHLPVLKIVITANDTAKNDSHVNELSEQERVTYVKKGGISVKDENHREQSVDSSISNITTKSDAEEWKLIGEPESQVKLPETMTQSVRLEERTSSIPETTPNLVPQGRTIGFSGVNEFPNIEIKSAATMKINGGSLVTQSLRNNTEKIDQRPYPYIKSNRESFQAITEASLKLKKEGGDITEETSAYENTIGRGESEKKLVVTEPSVVIENSIQQHKPNKKNVNEFTNSTTKSLSSSMPVTTIPIVSVDVGPTNGTLRKGFNGSVKATEMKRSKSNENDTSGAKEEEKVIVGRDEGYDVTGNGITEVSLTSDGKAVKSHSNEVTESSTSRSTETNTSKTVSLNTDVQMEPEEAMMIRSTFVVTESTSTIPLNKDTTEANRSKISTTSATAINTVPALVLENSTESASKTNVTSQPSSSANQTTESPSATLNPDESSIPTTTSIEFEFVSLTEAISSGINATERSAEGRTIEEQTMSSRVTTIQDPSAANNSTEDAVTAMKPEESTEFPVTTEEGTPTTDQMSDVHHVDNETTKGPQITSDSPNNRTELSKNEVTVNVIDFTNATVATEASGITEDPLKSKDSSFNANITETSAPGVTELPSNIDVRTTTNVTKSPSATSTLEPIVPWSIPSFTESSEEEITESIQTLSPDEITLLVKIIIEGTLHEVCPRLNDLRKALADVLRDGLDK